MENHRNNPDSGRMYAVYTGVRKGRVGLGWGGSVEGGCVVLNVALWIRCVYSLVFCGGTRKKWYICGAKRVGVPKCGLMQMRTSDYDIRFRLR